MATKTQTIARTVTLTQAGVLTVRLYARLKRAEKHIADTIAKAKAGLLALTGMLPEQGETVALVTDGGLKMASVSCQAGRQSIDAERLEREYPDAFNACRKVGEPSIVVRLH